MNSNESEEITFDGFDSPTLVNQVSSWNTVETFVERAKNGDWEKAREILTKAPDVEAEDFDRL
jgi:hypothetical protein